MFSHKNDATGRVVLGRVKSALALALGLACLPAYLPASESSQKQPASELSQNLPTNEPSQAATPSPAADNPESKSPSSQPSQTATGSPALLLPNLSPLTPEAQALDKGILPETPDSRIAPPESPDPRVAPATAELLPVNWETTDTKKRRPLPAAQTVADQRLQRIYDAQLEFFAQLEANPDMAAGVRDQRAQNLISQYQSLLLDNPEYVYGYIMYGKLLRQVGQRELANKAFVKANALDPNIAVVKQQIANYLSEEGDYDLALPYLLSAIRLAPETAVYHYQLGELLHTYRKLFLADGKLAAQVLDKQLQDAFANAARLDPATRIYALRQAESFFDIAEPDWQQALAQWQALEKTAKSEPEKQLILLQKCRVLIALDEKEQAQDTLAAVTESALQGAKQTLLAMLTDPELEQKVNSPAAVDTPKTGGET